MKTFGIKAVIFILILCLAVPSVCAAENGSAVNISVACSGDIRIGGEAVVKIAVSKPSQALEGIEFILKYDKTGVEPLYTENSEDGKELDILVTSMPSGWEQMSIHSENGYYHFRFAQKDGESNLLDEDCELALEIPFAITKAGVFDFTVESESIIAVAADEGSSLLCGIGGKATATVANESQKLIASLYGSAEAFEDGSYALKIRVTNIRDTEGIIAFSFDLKYDKAVFTPKITANDQEQMNAFITEAPQSNWEQMCSLDIENGVYTLRFAAKTAESLTESEKLLIDNSVLLTIPFKVIAPEGNIAEFVIESESIRALNNANDVIYGAGSSLLVTTEKAEIGVIPDHLGYEIIDGYLHHIAEKTDVSEFLGELNGFYLSDSEGNEIEGGNVCSGYILTDGINGYTVVVLGDVNCDGIADTYDYILAKRIYFETYVASELQTLAADINGDKKVDQYDYILIKRHYFGTYVIA